MSQATVAAPTLPLDIFLPRLAQFCIPRGLCQIFRRDRTFQQFQFRYQQIFYVRDIAEREHNIPISINALVRAFDCPRSSMQSELAHGLELPGERGKHPLLTPIVNNKFSTGFNKKPNKAHQSGKQK
jgi:hypothetical protein